jgi:hypothetical protein
MFEARQKERMYSVLLSPAQDSNTDCAPAQMLLSFPRACLARTRNPETGAWPGKKVGILRAAATRKNDRANNQHGPNCHYIRQLSIILGLSIMISAGIVEAQGSSLYVYPLKKQSSEQQNKDRYECHSWAVQQTGYDPSRAYPDNPNYLDPQPYRPTQPHVLKGAARGSALGAVGGAITGNAGKGAAAGAAMGGLAGGFRRLDEKRQRAAYQQSNVAAAAASQQANYTRAIAACLEGRGYSVK